MAKNRARYDSARCVIVAETFLDKVSGHSLPDKFSRVISDVAAVYPNAVLVGAVAASYYIRHSNEPRITYDVDILIDEREFIDFLEDEIPDDTLRKMETYFEDSDSANHSLKHRATGIYVDLLSTESKPVRKKTVKYILENREKTTNVLKVGETLIDILKPEFLVAMKMSRCTKSPRSERGLCDRIDIMKVLKTLWDGDKTLDQETIRAFLNRNEIKCFDSILSDVECELDD
jgi:hypothetical protein